MNNKLVIITGGVACVLLIAFGTLFFMMWNKISALDARANASVSEESAEEDSDKQMGPIYSLDSFIVNLDDPKYRKYLRVTMDLELVTEENSKEVEERLPPSHVVEEPVHEVSSNDRIHRVWIWQESKDCLWKLAKIYYKDPWKWKKIYLANRDRILDPSMIFPKQKIVIPSSEE